MLGETGLLALAGAARSSDPAEVGEKVLAALEARSDSKPPADDRTLIVLKRTDAPPPGPAVLRTASTVAKLLGLRRV
jgi:hypothetical protein